MNTVLNEKYGRHVPFCTGGSKNPENGKTSCAYYVPEIKFNVCKRIKDYVSEYAAESMPISAVDRGS